MTVKTDITAAAKHTSGTMAQGFICLKLCGFRQARAGQDQQTGGKQ